MDDLKRFLDKKKLKSDIERLCLHREHFFQLMFDSDFLSNAQMARMSKCSVPVVRSYMRVISKIFGVRDRWELILLCLDLDKVDRAALILNRRLMKSTTREPFFRGKTPAERLPVDNLTNNDWRTVIEHQKYQMREKIKQFDVRLKQIEEEYGI